MSARTEPIADLATCSKAFVSPIQIANYLGMPRRTIYYHIKKGALPVVKIGTQMYVRIEDARRYAAA